MERRITTFIAAIAIAVLGAVTWWWAGPRPDDPGAPDALDGAPAAPPPSAAEGDAPRAPATPERAGALEPADATGTAFDGTNPPDERALDRPVPLSEEDLKAALEDEISANMASYVGCLAAWHGELGYQAGSLVLELTYDETGLTDSVVRSGDEGGDSVPLATRSCLAGFVEHMDGFASAEGEVTLERQFRFLSERPAGIPDEAIRNAKIVDEGG